MEETTFRLISRRYGMSRFPSAFRRFSNRVIRSSPRMFLESQRRVTESQYKSRQRSRLKMVKMRFS